MKCEICNVQPSPLQAGTRGPGGPTHIPLHSFVRTRCKCRYIWVLVFFFFFWRPLALVLQFFFLFFFWFVVRFFFFLADAPRLMLFFFFGGAVICSCHRWSWRRGGAVCRVESGLVQRDIIELVLCETSWVDCRCL